MISAKRWAAIFFVCSTAVVSTYAQPKPTPSPTPAFPALLERAKKGDPALDFQELRMAYTETAGYSPYGADRASRQQMFAALNAKDYNTALELANKILAGNYLDINAQFGAYVSHRELTHTDEAAKHRFLFEGLIRSIEKSGDGKTPATAFVVISTDEEYALLNWMGLRATGQALVAADGHSYDRMTVLNPKTNEKADYYFNIDKPFNWLGKSLKK